ncbi:MAG: hypothetical protein LBP93_06375 [Treponema sp.]|jgi:hypothetical protein|nr:hypothetical protein [Treponema sp.]
MTRKLRRRLGRRARVYGVFVFLFFLILPAGAESLRVLIAGDLAVSQDNPEGASIALSYIDSVIIHLDRELRFFKGLELELTVPQNYLPHRGSLAIALYADLDKTPEGGVADLEGRRISFEPIPNKIQTIYQIPLRAGHGLRATPYVSIPAGIIPPSSFPVLFRLMPVIKGLSEEIESMRFHLNAKPLFSDEGAVKINPRYPEQLPGRPFTVLLDDEVIDNPQDERLLKEGEHHLIILSDDYRNESRRFLIERGKILDLTINLQDPTPLVIFEAPENALIFFDGKPVANNSGAIPAEPGTHEVKFQMSDYSIIRTLSVQKGKTYRVALAVDVTISETE